MVDRVHYMHPGPWPVYVGFTTSPKAFAREIRRMDIEGGDDFLASDYASATTHMFNAPCGMRCYIICMPPFEDSETREQYAALLAHEGLHVIQDMHDCLNRGESFGREADAYLLQMVVQECLHQAWGSGASRRVVPK